MQYHIHTHMVHMCSPRTVPKHPKHLSDVCGDDVVSVWFLFSGLVAPHMFARPHFSLLFLNTAHVHTVTRPPPLCTRVRHAQQKHNKTRAHKNLIEYLPVERWLASAHTAHTFIHHHIFVGRERDARRARKCAMYHVLAYILVVLFFSSGWLWSLHR